MVPVIFFDLDETLIFAHNWMFDVDPRIRIKSAINRMEGSTDETKLRIALRYRRELEMFETAPIIRLGIGATFSIQVLDGTFEEVRRAGQFAELHIFTAAAPEYAEAALTATGLRPYFQSVISLTETEIEPLAYLPPLKNRPWVLIDDTPAKDKLKVLRSVQPEGHLVRHTNSLAESVDKALILLEAY
jgi:phosphoglycolate phosphatase-like HAD superfamily hydrolase